MKHDAELRAQIILNHPQLYDSIMVKQAHFILSNRSHTVEKSSETMLAEIINLITETERFSISGDINQAILHYWRWLWFNYVTSPLAYIIHFNLGVLLHQIGDYNGAAQAYRQTLSKVPDFAPAQQNLQLLISH